MTNPALRLAVPAASRAPVDLFVAGVGHVGGALLAQVAALEDRPLRLVGACVTDGCVWRPEGLDAVDEALAASAAPDWDALERQLAAHPHPLVFVDATGSPAVARRYAALLAAGVHVVTPSKHGNTFEQAYFDRLRRLTSGTGTHFKYEATVGAGLPVVRVVQDLVATGDRVRRIEGVFSGTMTYLFSRVEAGVPFSQAVAEAVAEGYAEPDPRDDLSGEDVVRKLLTLARTAGYPVERGEVEVETLIPEALRGVPRERFVGGLAAYDAGWAARRAAAEAEGQRLRYVGRLAEGRIRIGVEAVAERSALGRLADADNLIQVWTDRYTASPLTVQGPGAGPAVTAGGVLADVLDIAGRVAR